MAYLDARDAEAAAFARTHLREDETLGTWLDFWMRARAWFA